MGTIHFVGDVESHSVQVVRDLWQYGQLFDAASLFRNVFAEFDERKLITPYMWILEHQYYGFRVAQRDACIGVLFVQGVHVSCREPVGLVVTSVDLHLSFQHEDKGIQPF